VNTKNDTLDEPQPELRRRQIPAGAARVAVFTRTYDAAVEDVWDACTNPERLRRWYAPVSGDLRLGGHFKQALMSSGVILACDPPQHLKLSLGDGADEIELRLTSAEDARTVLELEHATTMDRHDIGGETFDVIFCMGGGYYPRFAALRRHLRGELPDRYDPTTFHRDPAIRAVIDRGSAAMAALLEANPDDSRAEGRR
jgi:uncharacterized protein YndB with AHSA1/START domain